MNTTRTMNMYINPMLAWNELAWKTGVLMLTSAQVILQRNSNAALDVGYIETQLIGQEKIDAMLDSVQASGAQMIMMGHQLASMTYRQVLSTSSELIAPGSSKIATESMNRHSKLIRKTLNNSVIAGSRLSASVEKVARSRLQPVKKRFEKNVKRLVKHK
jgi:hypothetical protein